MAEKEERPPKSLKLPAANEIFEHWDEEFREAIEDIKRDVAKVLGVD